MPEACVTPEMIAAAWDVWKPRRHHYAREHLGPGPAFRETIEAALKAGRPQFEAALATAVARARREALEEAAKTVDALPEYRYPIYVIPGEGRVREICVPTSRAECASAIRALAATPPEARQTETNP